MSIGSYHAKTYAVRANGIYGPWWKPCYSHEEALGYLRRGLAVLVCYHGREREVHK